MPATPDGNSFDVGLGEPHGLSTYVSPNDGKPYGIITDKFHGTPTYLGIIDMQALLAAPRVAGTHTVDPNYNLITNGVVRYVATGLTVEIVKPATNKTPSPR